MRQHVARQNFLRSQESPSWSQSAASGQRTLVFLLFGLSVIYRTLHGTRQCAAYLLACVRRGGLFVLVCTSQPDHLSGFSVYVRRRHLSFGESITGGSLVQRGRARSWRSQVLRQSQSLPLPKVIQ